MTQRRSLWQRLLVVELTLLALYVIVSITMTLAGCADMGNPLLNGGDDVGMDDPNGDGDGIVDGGDTDGDGMDTGNNGDMDDDGDIVDPGNDPQDDPGDDEPDVEPLPGLPDYTAGYTTWLRMNAKPIPPTAADPHNGTKNVYVNQERAAIAPNNRQEFPYPDGSILVKESTRQGQDFIWLFAIMRKVKGSDPAHGDWEYTEYIRIEANADFRLASRDGICWGCHFGAAGSDWSFTTLDPE